MPDPHEGQVKGLSEAFSQQLPIVIIFIKD